MSSTIFTADKFPNPSISIIGRGSKSLTISSVILYFVLNYSLFFMSLNAAQSSGESDGTEVTIPVPLKLRIKKLLYNK